MVSIRWYVGFLNWQVGGASAGIDTALPTSILLKKVVLAMILDMSPEGLNPFEASGILGGPGYL